MSYLSRPNATNQAIIMDLFRGAKKVWTKEELKPLLGVDDNLADEELDFDLKALIKKGFIKLVADTDGLSYELV